MSETSSSMKRGLVVSDLLKQCMLLQRVTISSSLSLSSLDGGKTIVPYIYKLSFF